MDIYKRWNVVTFKNGERKNHYFRTDVNFTCDDVALHFSLRYNGDEGRVLEIIPID